MRCALLLHGFTGAPDAWDGVRRALPSDVACEVPWITGHGRPPAALEVTSFEAETARLAALAPDGSVVAGYSQGARLALAIACRAQRRLRAAVLVSGSPGLKTDAERRARVEQDAVWRRLLEERGLDAFVAAWEAQPLFAAQAQLPPPARVGERERRLGHTAMGLAHALGAVGLGVMPSYWSELGGLDLELEVLAGALDVKFCSIGRAVVSELPRGRFSEVPQASHNLLLERPDAVAAAITRALGG